MSSARLHSDVLRRSRAVFAGRFGPSRSGYLLHPHRPQVSKPRDRNKRPFPWKFVDRRLDPVALATRILTPVLHPLAAAAIIFIVAIVILLQQDDLRDRVIRLFGSRDLHRTTLAMDDAALAAKPFLSHPIRYQRYLWRNHRSGALFHRASEFSAVGNYRHSDALRSVHRAATWLRPFRFYPQLPSIPAGLQRFGQQHCFS